MVSARYVLARFGTFPHAPHHCPKGHGLCDMRRDVLCRVHVRCTWSIADGTFEQLMHASNRQLLMRYERQVAGLRLQVIGLVVVMPLRCNDHQ